MRLTITDGATPAWRAAAEKLPARAVARKALILRSVSIGLSPFEKDHHAKLFDPRGDVPRLGRLFDLRQRHNSSGSRLFGTATSFGTRAHEGNQLSLFEKTVRS